MFLNKNTAYYFFTQFSDIYLFLCAWLFCLHVCLCNTCIQCLQRPEETGVTEGCEKPLGAGS